MLFAGVCLQEIITGFATNTMCACIFQLGNHYRLGSEGVNLANDLSQHRTQWEQN